MTLTDDERQLLELVARAPEPVAMSSFFGTLNPATFDRDVPDDDPDRVAWLKRQMKLYEASLGLWQAELVRIVHPANGERPDLVTATDAGRDALA